MIITTMDDGLEFVKDRKYAHLVCGASPVFTAKTKRFREGEGAKLFETLKRFVSSSAFDVILVTNADKMLAREENMESPYLKGQLHKVLPVVNRSGSDSAMLDNTLEFLVMSGMDLPLAVMRVMLSIIFSKYIAGSGALKP